MDSSLDYTISDYLASLRRRRRVLMIVALPILFISCVVAVILPDKYTSSAEISVSLEGSNLTTLEPIDVSTYADQYIAKLEDRVMTGKNIWALAGDADLLSADQEELTQSEMNDRIWASVVISLATQQVVSPRDGRAVELISGMNVASVDTDPDFAFRVADHLAGLFLKADRESRTEQASSTLTFLLEQMAQTERQILELEKLVAEFKVSNACCLPELVGLNTSVIQRAERELEGIEPRIRTLSQNRMFLQAQLEELGQIDSENDRLAQLEQEYMTLVASYGPDHPDVSRVRREIIAISNVDSNDENAFELIDLRVKLREAQQKYSEQHPDIIRYKRELAVLEARRRQGGSVAVEARLLENPRYIQLRGELNAVETQLNELRRNQPVLRQKIAEYEQRLVRTPQVESEYQGLTRKLQSARENFDDLQRRSVVARQSEALESTDIGARLFEVSPASVPKLPSGPPRIAIAVLGIFLALSLGIGSALFSEMTDRTVRSSKDVVRELDMVPLANIPVIDNSVRQSSDEGRKRMMVATAFVVAIAAAVLYFAASS